MRAAALWAAPAVRDDGILPEADARLEPNEWRAQDWVAYFAARKRLAERRNGCSPTKAGALAFECCVVEWLNRHPAPTAPGRCSWCGEAESTGTVILPFGTEPETHTWLHRRCWGAWHQKRRSDAISALSGVFEHENSNSQLQGCRPRADSSAAGEKEQSCRTTLR